MGILDDLMTAPAGRWYKFDKVGAVITGKIVGLRDQQARDFTTGKPIVWDDGNPGLELLVMLATDAREDEDDDGVRTVRIKGWGIQRNSLRDACMKAGRPPIVGDMFRAQYVGDEPSTRGGFPSKKYEYTIKLQPEAPVDPAQGRGIVPPYVEQKAKDLPWPDEDVPF
jgi:hypothetical protein